MALSFRAFAARLCAMSLKKLLQWADFCVDSHALKGFIAHFRPAPCHCPPLLAGIGAWAASITQARLETAPEVRIDPFNS
jgi:hypothetical protein